MRFLRLRPKVLSLRREAALELTPAGWARHDLAELILLTYFLQRLLQRPFFRKPVE